MYLGFLQYPNPDIENINTASDKFNNYDNSIKSFKPKKNL